MTTARIGGRNTWIFTVAGLMGLAAVAVLAFGVVQSAAEAAPDPISVELLTPRAEFTDDVATQIRLKFDGHGTKVLNLRDASNIAVAEITIQPGARFPWHTHPGPVMITIAKGDFVYVLAKDCVERDYEGGDALIDAGGDNVHTAFNPSETDETVVVATFLGAPEEGPLTVPVAEDEGEELDEKCGFSAASHSH